MKKILIVLLLLSIAFTMLSCGEKTAEYAPVEQTEEEGSTVVSMTYGESAFDVPYDIYRALFLNMKTTVDGGDDSVWVGEERDKYVSRINGYVFDMLAEIYTAFALCDSLGYDMYSDEVDGEIRDYVANTVDNGYLGDYDAYLADLKAANLNYSAQELMIRYAFAEEVLTETYISIPNDSDAETLFFGSEEYGKEDVLNFYNSDDVSRVLYTSVSAYVTDGEERANEFCAGLKSAAEESEDEAKGYFGRNSALSISEIENGIIISKNILTSSSFSVAEVAKELSEGGVSNVIKAGTGDDSYYVVYKMGKNVTHFEEKYTEIATAFLKDKMGAMKNSVKDALLESITESDFFKNLDYSDISI